MNQPNHPPSTTKPPKALWVWDNRARLSLPPALAAWLAMLVLSVLAGFYFVGDHIAPRWLLVGFLVSHVIVFGLGAANLFTMRRGFVSLSHVVCWSPGLVMLLGDLISEPAFGLYFCWSMLVATILSISLLFDVRDSVVYLRHLFS